MNNITYENQGNNTYLVYEIDGSDIIDSLSLGMINNNKIAGLAPVIYTQIDDRKYLKYNISAKVSASTFLAGATSKNRILGILSSVSKALLSAEEYMLDANTILLDLDFIFVDVTTCEAELICLPVQRGNFNDVLSFFKNLVFSVTYDQTENCDYVAKIISCLNSHSSFSLANFMQTIDELNGKRINLQELQNSQQLSLPKEPVAQKPQAPQQLEPQPQEPKPPVSQPQAPQVGRQLAPSQQSGGMQVPPQRRMQVPPQGRIPTPPQAGGKKGKGIPPVQPNYVVPGAPRQQPPVQQPPMPPQAGNIQQQKKQGIFFGLFKKKNKSVKQGAMPGMPASVGTVPPQMMRQGRVPSQGAGIPQAGRTGMPGTQPPRGGMPMQARQPQQPQPPQTVMPVATEQAAAVSQKVPEQPPVVERHMDFGDTVVLGEEMNHGDTILLSAPAEVQPYLVRKKTGEKVFIKGPIFRIGKEHNYVDYFIGDNSAISRSHANIIVNGNDYFIIDTNSKNHTYVNGMMIASNVQTQLTHGNILKLANEEFEFRMY